MIFLEMRLPVTISAGVADLMAGDEGPDALIARADKALYQAKQQGRNRTCCYNEQPI